MTMKTVSATEMHFALRTQRVPPEHRALKCPACGTVQSAFDFIEAGAGKDVKEVAKYLGTSCVGRFTGADAPRRTPDGKACNWTLGGFLQLHKLEVVDDEGQHHPFFDTASPEEAQTHAVDNLLRRRQAPPPAA